MDVWKTVVQLIGNKTIKKADFAKKIGITRQTLDNWLKGETHPNQDDLTKMSNAIMEMRTMLSIEANTEKLFKTFKLHASQKARKEDVEVAKNLDRLIPLYDAVAVGGNALLADQTAIAEPAEYIDPGSWLRSATGSLRVYGNSMFPKYPAGSIIAFKESTSGVIIWGEDYVIELEDRRIVKRVDKSKVDGHIKAVSYNNNNEKYIYDPIDIPLHSVKRLYMVLGCVTLEASI